MALNHKFKVKLGTRSQSSSLLLLSVLSKLLSEWCHKYMYLLSFLAVTHRERVLVTPL